MRQQGLDAECVAVPVGDDAAEEDARETRGVGAADGPGGAAGEGGVRPVLAIRAGLPLIGGGAGVHVRGDAEGRPHGAQRGRGEGSCQRGRFFKHFDSIGSRGRRVAVRDHAVEAHPQGIQRNGDADRGGLCAIPGALVVFALAAPLLPPLIGELAAPGGDGDHGRVAQVAVIVSRLLHDGGGKLAEGGSAGDSRITAAVRDPAAVLIAKVVRGDGHGEGCGLVAGRGGVFPGAAAVGAHLPLVGELAAHGHHGEDGSLADAAREVLRLGGEADGEGLIGHLAEGEEILALVYAAVLAVAPGEHVVAGGKHRLEVRPLRDVGLLDQGCRVYPVHAEGAEVVAGALAGGLVPEAQVGGGLHVHRGSQVGDGIAHAFVAGDGAGAAVQLREDPGIGLGVRLLVQLGGGEGQLAAGGVQHVVQSCQGDGDHVRRDGMAAAVGDDAAHLHIIVSGGGGEGVGIRGGGGGAGVYEVVLSGPL